LNIQQEGARAAVSSGVKSHSPARHGSETTSTTQHHLAIPPQSHHFSFSI